MESQKKSDGSSATDESKKKERNIVSWTEEEDNTLRLQITLNGTENWATIASHFKDKTNRQCRRRWYTYLNSNFKRGGWSPEEDMLLCEAQRVFGNRWTEIAKVVSGRTDNAVKNRFSTLCKKRAKYEATIKQNEENDPPKKKIRSEESPASSEYSTGSTAEISAVETTPLFRTMAAGIPSPKFSESERSFLLKTLGMESPHNHTITASHPPSCKRALLQSL